MYTCMYISWSLATRWLGNKDASAKGQYILNNFEMLSIDGKQKKTLKALDWKDQILILEVYL